MSEKNDNFENGGKIKRNNTDSGLQTLKIIAIVFILLLSVAISAYIVISYFQNNKISFSDEVSNKSQSKTIETENQKILANEQNQQIISDSPANSQGSENNSFQILKTPDYTNSYSINESSQNINTGYLNEKSQIKPDSEKSDNASQSSTNTNNKKINSSKVSNITYVVQIASFTDFDKAISLKNKLEKAGIPCYIVITEIDGKYYYRIRSGKFEDKKDAIALINKIKTIESTVSPIIIQN